MQPTSQNPQEASAPPKIYDAFVRRGLFLSFVCFAGFMGWFLFQNLDEGVIATGAIAVESRTKTVQHLEGGIIAEVLVDEGQDVQAGDVLIRLDTTQSQARRNQASTQLATTLARLDRLEAERLGHADIEFRPELRQDDLQIAQILDVQQNLFDARRTQVLGQVNILEQRIEQLADQIDGLVAQRAASEAQISLIREEIERYSRVEELQPTDVRNRLQRERELAQVEGQLGQIDADRARTEVSIGEARIEILQVERTFQENVASELTDAQDRALSLQDELRALDDVLARTDIIAPASGAILNMEFSTVGGVIPPGQPILDIVPLGDELVIDAQIAVNDVNNVTEGQSARITIAALNPRTTPELKGSVVTWGADAVQDQTTGVPFYPARIAFNAGELEKLQGQALRPGMATQVFLEGGQRTPLDYMWQPISDTFRRALNEPSQLPPDPAEELRPEGSGG